MTYTRTIRPTGEKLTVGTAAELGIDPEGGKWVTVCEDHSTIANSATQALAYAARGADFCEGCRTRIKRNPTNTKVNFNNHAQVRAYQQGARDAYDLLVTMLEEGGDINYLLEGIANNASPDVVARLDAFYGKKN